MTRFGPSFTASFARARGLVTLFALLAFAFQGFVVQTHIHGQPRAGAVQLHQAAQPSTPAPADPYDPAHCPLCQEMLHAGVFITPAPLLFAVLLAAMDFTPLFQARSLARQTRLHGWQSRAPPRR